MSARHAGNMDPAELAAAVLAGDRQALAAAITLTESTLAEDEARAETLLRKLLPHSGKARRIGITGAPGVGKSTLIETLGTQLCDAGHRIAVLAVDPSSVRTGGSILGDKTRMQKLASREDAFVRPSPGGETPGGTAAKTRESLLVCEAAGFDVVIVETIGTGQSETAVAGMVDFFLLLLSPAAGDELQGIKRGVMELADGVVVHKADGNLLQAAEHAAQQCRLALQVLHSGASPETPTPVLVGSSIDGRGMDEIWPMIEEAIQTAQDSGALATRRQQQAGEWLDATLRARLLADFMADPDIAAALPQLREAVMQGRELPSAATRQLLELRGRK